MMPPFEAGFRRNANNQLGAEYYNIADSIYRGEGFANPFRDPTGPTAWMPPVLPGLLAGLLWISNGNVLSVILAIVLLKAFTLIATGALILIVASRTALRLSSWVVLAIMVVWLVVHFSLAFQQTHDCWLNLLCLMATFAWASFAPPLSSRSTSVAWGCFGGFTALVTPVVGFTWGILTLWLGSRADALRRSVIAGLFALLVITPWTTRNYLVFDRFIPIKSNLGYELYVSQCLESDGVYSIEQMVIHPYFVDQEERKAYKQMGEMAYLDQKMKRFTQAVRRDPVAWVEKIGHRFLAATLIYSPLSPGLDDRVLFGRWLSQLTHSLPFLAAVLLLGSAPWYGLRREQSLALLIYASYLTPYIVISYYDRYGFPLFGIKILLMVWAADRLLELFRSRPLFIPRLGQPISHPTTNSTM